MVRKQFQICPFASQTNYYCFERVICSFLVGTVWSKITRASWIYLSGRAIGLGSQSGNTYYAVRHRRRTDTIRFLLSVCNQSARPSKCYHCQRWGVRKASGIVGRYEWNSHNSRPCLGHEISRWSQDGIFLWTANWQRITRGTYYWHLSTTVARSRLLNTQIPFPLYAWPLFEGSRCKFKG